MSAFSPIRTSESRDTYMHSSRRTEPFEKVTYDRRAMSLTRLGMLGVTYEQLSAAVRKEMGLTSGPVNIVFGAFGSQARELWVEFSATSAGKKTTGKVVFALVQVDEHQWGGSSILLECRVEIL